MEVEVVWHGAHWRDYPAPIMAREAFAPERGRPPKQATPERLLTVLTGEWQPVQAIAADVGLSLTSVRPVLAMLVASGRVERERRRAAECRRGGPREYHYRLRCETPTGNTGGSLIGFGFASG